MSCCQGFVGKVYDPLRVRFFFGRTLGMPSRGVVGLLPSQEVVLTSWEAWVGLCLGGCLLPCLRVLLLLLARPAWVPGGLGGLLPSSEGRRALAWEGEEVIPWERLLSSLGGVAPTWRALAWEREEVEPAWRALAWEREEVLAWERLPSSPGGVAPAWGTLAWERGELVAWERLLSSPGGGHQHQPGEECLLPWPDC